MGKGATKRSETPDETRELEHGRIDIVHLAGSTAAHVTFEPGWRWATDIKPLVGTDSCQAHHVDHRVADSLHVVTDEGNELDIGDGDAYEILPGHEAWVVGDESFVGLEFKSAAEYAKG